MESSKNQLPSGTSISSNQIHIGDVGDSTSRSRPKSVKFGLIKSGKDEDSFQKQPNPLPEKDMKNRVENESDMYIRFNHERDMKIRAENERDMKIRAENERKMKNRLENERNMKNRAENERKMKNRAENKRNMEKDETEIILPVKKFKDEFLKKFHNYPTSKTFCESICRCFCKETNLSRLKKLKNSSTGKYEKEMIDFINSKCTQLYKSEIETYSIVDLCVVCSLIEANENKAFIIKNKDLLKQTKQVSDQLIKLIKLKDRNIQKKFIEKIIKILSDKLSKGNCNFASLDETELDLYF